MSRFFEIPKRLLKKLFPRKRSSHTDYENISVSKEKDTIDVIQDLLDILKSRGFLSEGKDLLEIKTVFMKIYLDEFLKILKMENIDLETKKGLILSFYEDPYSNENIAKLRTDLISVIENKLKELPSDTTIPWTIKVLQRKYRLENTNDTRELLLKVVENLINDAIDYVRFYKLKFIVEEIKNNKDREVLEKNLFPALERKLTSFLP